MSAKEKVLADMDREFSRQDWMDRMADTGLSYSHASRLLDVAVYDGDVERTGRGQYQKNEPQAQAV